MIKCREDVPMYVKVVSREQENLQTTFEHSDKGVSDFSKNTVLLYFCDTEEVALHQIVLNIIEKEFSQN